MGYAGRQNIYEATIRRMVAQALEEQEEQFRQEHEADTDDQLIAYLQAAAEELQDTPHQGEILGGKLIAERFGSWENALEAARLLRSCRPNKPAAFLRVQQEEVRQKEIYRQRKAEKRILSEKRRTQQAAKKKGSEK